MVLVEEETIVKGNLTAFWIYPPHQPLAQIHTKKKQQQKNAPQIKYYKEESLATIHSVINAERTKAELRATKKINHAHPNTPRIVNEPRMRERSSRKTSYACNML